MKSAIERLTRPLGTLAKWVVLAFVLMRFHGSWLGFTVVLLMGVLLFRVDRTVWHIATGKMRS